VDFYVLYSTAAIADALIAGTMVYYLKKKTIWHCKVGALHSSCNIGKRWYPSRTNSLLTTLSVYCINTAALACMTHIVTLITVSLGDLLNNLCSTLFLGSSSPLKTSSTSEYSFVQPNVSHFWIWLDGSILIYYFNFIRLLWRLLGESQRQRLPETESSRHWCPDVSLNCCTRRK